MNCFYCGFEMVLKSDLYMCIQDSFIGEFCHMFDVEQNNCDDKEFRFYTKISSTGYYDAIFYSLKSSDAANWQDSIFLEDFSILKEIKTSKQLQKFIDKLKVFK